MWNDTENIKFSKQCLLKYFLHFSALEIETDLNYGAHLNQIRTTDTVIYPRFSKPKTNNPVIGHEISGSHKYHLAPADGIIIILCRAAHFLKIFGCYRENF